MDHAPRSRGQSPLRARSARLTAAGAVLFAAVWSLLVALVGAGAEPGYSHVAQFISELGADGAANARAVSLAGFAPIGVATLAFVTGLAYLLPRSRGRLAAVAGLACVGLAYLAAAVFPCDAGCPSEGSVAQSIHNAFGFLEYAGAVAGLAILAATCRRSARWRSLAPVCAAAALVAGAGFAAMLVPSLAPVRGASQRVAEIAIFGWIACVSVWLLRCWPRDPDTR